jgi:hypothetical protein
MEIQKRATQYRFHSNTAVEIAQNLTKAMK